MVSTTVLILFAMAVYVQARMMPSYTRPKCEPSEPCRFVYFDIQMQFCDCPGEGSLDSADTRECSANSENRLTIRDSNYHFCDPPIVYECSRGEVALVRRGFRQFIRCLCVAPFALHTALWDPQIDLVEYSCVEPVVCEPKAQCAVREHGTKTDGKTPVHNLSDICQCQEGSQCRMNENVSLLEETTDGITKKEFGYCT